MAACPAHIDHFAARAQRKRQLVVGGDDLGVGGASSDREAAPHRQVAGFAQVVAGRIQRMEFHAVGVLDRTSVVSGKSLSVRVVRGGVGLIKKKNTVYQQQG